MTRLAGNRIDAPGTREQAWDSWRDLRLLPAADPSSWPSVAVVAAHPDDEVLGVGGTMAILAAAWMLINIDPVPDGRKAGSLTWAGLFNTYYWIDPTMRIAGVIMMQILPFADRQALKAYRQFERGICRALGPA